MLGVARSRLCSYTLALALALSGLGLGAVHLPVLVAYAALTVTSALLSCSPEAAGHFWRRARGRQEDGSTRPSSSLRRRIGVAAGVWFCLTLACWLQVVPLPLSWLEHVAPLNADVWSRALRPFQEAAPALASISLAPGRTLVEALEVATYGLVFGVSARLAGRHGFASISWLIFGSAGLVAAATAAHQMLAAERVYGFYTPVDARVIAPILNENSLAGYLNLGFCCGLGLLFRERASPWNPLLGVALICIAAESLLCQSRAGLVSFCLALLTIAILQLNRRAAQRPERWSRLRRLLALGLVSAGAAAFAGLAVRFENLHRLADDSLQKLDLLERSSHLAREQLGLGVGRGAFGSVFFAYAEDGRNVAYDHAENLLLQWASEWGIWLTLAALLALGWALAPLSSRSVFRSPTARCALVGSGALLLQNLVDLGLEIPAVGALLACTLGGLLGTLQRPAARGTSVQPRVAPSSRFMLLGALLTVLAGVLAVAGGSPPLPTLRQQLFALLGGAHGGKPGPELWSALREATLAFPADPYFPLLGSSAALADGKNALPWITRALERSPRNSEAHVQLARILHARGATGQALGALRRAVELSATQSKVALALGTSWGLTPAALLPAVPEGRRGGALLRLLALQEKDPAKRIEWLREAVVRAPGDAESRYRLAAELLEDLARKDAAVVCQDRAVCAASIREHAALGERPGDPRVVILLAQLLAEEGKPALGESELWQECQRFAGNTGCDAALVTLSIQNESSRAQEAVKRYLASGCARPSACAQTELHLGQVFSRAGHWNVALTHYERAAREAPSPSTWQAVALASRQTGNSALEAEALRKARQSAGQAVVGSRQEETPATTGPGVAAPPRSEPPR